MTAMQTSVRLALSLTLAAGAIALIGCGSDEAQKKPDKPVTQEQKPAELTPEQAIAADLGDARQLMKKGEFEGAKKKFQAVLTRDDKNLDARLGLAECQIALREHETAEMLLKEVRAEKPDNRQAALLLGGLYQETAKYDDGVTLFQSLLEKDPHDVALLNNLIVMYRLKGDYGKAEETCTRLLSREPDNVAALKNLSLVYFDQGKYALSETIAINSLKLSDKDAALYNNRGMIRVQKGRYPEAISFFRKAVELDPTLTNAHLNIGSISLRYRDYETASRHYGEAVKLEPRHPAANLGYGLALAGQENTDQAIPQLNRALEIDPQAHAALGELCRVYKLQMNDLPKAEDFCKKYVDAKGKGLKADDPIKLLYDNILNEKAANEAMRKMQEEAAAAEAAEGAPAEGGEEENPGGS